MRASFAFFRRTDRETLQEVITELKQRVGVPVYGSKPAAAPSANAADAEAALPAEPAAVASSIKDAKSNERKELLADSVAQLVGLYSIVMACLLLLFVEQVCPATDANPEPHACTLADDFNSPYERAVIVVNFFCLGLFVIAQAIFWMREKFMCAHHSVCRLCVLLRSVLTRADAVCFSVFVPMQH